MFLSQLKNQLFQKEQLLNFIRIDAVSRTAVIAFKTNMNKERVRLLRCGDDHAVFGNKKIVAFAVDGRTNGMMNNNAKKLHAAHLRRLAAYSICGCVYGGVWTEEQSEEQPFFQRIRVKRTQDNK